MTVLEVASTLDASSTRTGHRHSTHYHVVALLDDGVPVAACNRSAMTNYDGPDTERPLGVLCWDSGTPLDEVPPRLRCRRSGCSQRWPK